MELINDILDLSKIESGRLELEKAEFEVGGVIQEVVDLLAPKAHDKGIGLRSWHPPDVSGRVVGDAGRLRQVLVNLVGNAIKFTSSGEVVVSVEAGEAGTAAELTFAVSDTGIGIPKDKLATIFEAFQQVDASTSRKYGGTGLGLPICQRLVECMGGVLRVESEPGRGSTFQFTAKFEESRSGSQPKRIPEPSRPQPAPPVSSAGSARAPSRPVRILVAEDSQDNQFLLKAYLKESPYVLSFAGDGRAAVKQFRDGDFEGVLMDMEMPVMDGLTATRALREIEKRQGRQAVPILALTGNAHREAIQACESAGCTTHIAKPVSKAELLGALARLLAAAPAAAPAVAHARTVAGGHRVSGAAIPSGEHPMTGAPPFAPGVAISPMAVPAGLEALVPKYLSARRKELPEMVALLAASDFDQISSRGHNMKGTGRSYGFPDLTEIGAALERFAKLQDKDSIEKQLMRLANYLECVRVQGEQALEQVR